MGLDVHLFRAVRDRAYMYRVIDSGLVGSTGFHSSHPQGHELSGRGTTRAEDAQGTPAQSHISPSILGYEDKHQEPPFLIDTTSHFCQHPTLTNTTVVKTANTECDSPLLTPTRGSESYLPANSRPAGDDWYVGIYKRILGQ